MEKDSLFAKEGSMDDFESILTLLIYGLVLFPNIEGLIDVNAIQIFLIRNPVPTLLGDAYHLIHHRNSKGYGAITCCSPLLYKWFMSHLPQSRFFKNDPDKPRWSQRIMSLTQADLTWYIPTYDIEAITESYGEVPNVPLLGIYGGINYNPFLTRRQFGYTTKDKSDNIWLAILFYLNEEGNQGLRDKIVNAWRNIHKKVMEHLGRMDCVTLEPYTKCVRARACSLKMPYPPEEPYFCIATPSSPPVLTKSREDLQEALARMKVEINIWEKRLRTSELKKKERENQLKEKDDVGSLCWHQFW